MSQLRFTYREPRVLTRILQGLLVIQILSSLIVAGVLLGGGGQPVRMPPLAFKAYTICSIIPVIIWLPLLVVLMFWIYRISKNTHILTRKAMEFSPGWAVGWWFVPFASLVQPIRVVAELYNANANPENWRDKIPVIIAAWWALVIIGSLAGVIASIATASGATTPLTLSGALMATLTVHQTLALIIYMRIARWQRKARTTPGIEDVF